MSSWFTLPGLINNLFGEVVGDASNLLTTTVLPLFGGHDKPKNTHPRSPLDITNQILGAPGTVPNAPAPPPAPPGQTGGLPTGAANAGDQYRDGADAASLTDQKLAEILKQIFASNQQARDKVGAILNEIETKARAVGPELGDPAALGKFQEFLDQKFAEIQKILSDAQVDAKTQAAILDALGEEYRHNGPKTPRQGGDGDGTGNDGPGSGPGRDAGADTGGGPDAASGTAPGTAPPGADNGAGQVVDPLAGMGPLGGMGGMDPGSALAPALAGLSSLPAALGSLGGLGGGAGSPLQGLGPALGSLAGLAGQNGFTDGKPTGPDSRDGFSDKPSDSSGKDKPAADPAAALRDDRGGSSQAQSGETTGDNAGGAGARDAGAKIAPAGTAPAAAAPATESAPGSADSARSVAMPDGSVVTAPSAQAASAMRAVLSGQSVSAAYDAVGVHLAPPGTPVTDPVDPAHLEPGCVARFQSRDPVMAMGNGKIWMDGQLQPLGALGSTSDFLGWTKPVAAAQTATGAV